MNDPENNELIHGNEKDALLIDHLEECRLGLRKLQQYATLNLEGFRKALKKFDKHHGNRTAPLMDTVMFKVQSRKFSDISPLQKLDMSLEFNVQELINRTSISKIDRQRTREEIRNIWNDIYSVQVKTILERDDAQSLLEATKSLRLNDDSQLFPSSIDNSNFILRREQGIFLNSLLQGICLHKSKNCLKQLLVVLRDLSKIERQMNMSLIRKVIESPGTENDYELLQLLLSGNATVNWRDVRGHNLVYLAILFEKSSCLDVLLSTEIGYHLFDNDGCSPLYFAVQRGNVEIIQQLLDSYQRDSKPVLLLEGSDIPPLILASKMGHLAVLRELLNRGFDVNLSDSDGETSLYHCTKRNYVECMRLLLEKGADPETAEAYENWTPLFIAAIMGLSTCTDILLTCGAQKDKKDRQGWFPFEHAMLRGFPTLARALRPQGYDPSVASKDWQIFGKFTIENEPEFGHAYLQTQTQLRITLGHSHGLRTNKPVVEILDRPIAKVTNLQFRISANNSLLRDPIYFDLPIRDTPEIVKLCVGNDHKMVFKPWDEIRFDIFDRKIDELSSMVGRGTIMFNLVVGNDGRPLFCGSKQFIVPILDRNTFEPMALVSLEILIATPFISIQAAEQKRIYWKSVSTKVIGHRGLGANSGLPYPQIGENTLLSFVMAASLGAEYVEFDVQLTKDKIPVLYHDFIVSETGLEVSMSSLTLKQFLELRDHLSKNKLAMGQTRHLTLDDSATTKTTAFKKVIEGPFATLKEAFRKIQSHIGFNIEVKYPMKDEFEAAGMQHVFEINEYCDNILAVTFAECKERPVLFSSFHPDVCLLLSLKQVVFPVFFLTEGGMSRLPNEPRANSIHQAIRFAKEANLLGIVCHSTPLVEAPRLIRLVKENCLLLFTYGPQNNDVKSVQLQTNHGVDAVIVDSVAQIRRGLQQ